MGGEFTDRDGHILAIRKLRNQQQVLMLKQERLIGLASGRLMTPAEVAELGALEAGYQVLGRAVGHQFDALRRAEPRLITVRSVS